MYNSFNKQGRFDVSGRPFVSVIGIPLAVCGKLYNCAVVISNEKTIGAAVTKHIPNYSEFYEVRHFTAAGDGVLLDFNSKV